MQSFSSNYVSYIYIFLKFGIKIYSFIFKMISYYHILRLLVLPYFLLWNYYSFKVETRKVICSDRHGKVKYLLYFLGVFGAQFSSHFLKIHILYFNFRCMLYVPKHAECLSQYHIYWDYENCRSNIWVFNLLLSIYGVLFKSCFIYIYIYFEFGIKIYSISFKMLSYYHILRLLVLPYFYYEIITF